MPLTSPSSRRTFRTRRARTVSLLRTGRISTERQDRVSLWPRWVTASITGRSSNGMSTSSATSARQVCGGCRSGSVPMGPRTSRTRTTPARSEPPHPPIRASPSAPRTSPVLRGRRSRPGPGVGLHHHHHARTTGCLVDLFAHGSRGFEGHGHTADRDVIGHRRRHDRVDHRHQGDAAMTEPRQGGDA